MSKSIAHEWGRQKDGPWWRFVPRSMLLGCLSVAAGFLLLVEALSSLYRGTGNTAFGTTVEIFLAVVSVIWIAQSADGIRVLRQRRHIRRND